MGMQFFRRIWTRLEPWLARVEHLDFLIGKISTAAWLIKLIIVPMTAGFIALLLGIVDKTPKALLFLVVMAALVLGLAIVLIWKMLTAPSEVIAQKTRLARRNKTGGKAQKQVIAAAAPSIGIFGLLFTAVVTATILIVGYRYMTDHDAVERTVLSVHPAGVLFPGGKIPAFGMNILWLNKGTLSVDNGLIHYTFEFPNRVLTYDEESRYSDEISTFSPTEFAINELQGGESSWRSFFDYKNEMQNWQDVLDGKMVVYLFMTFQYYVEGNKKLTEFCLYLNQDYPAVHNCVHSNKTIDE